MIGRTNNAIPWTPAYYIWAKLEIESGGPGRFIEFASSTSDNTYPKNGSQGGFWYVMSDIGGGAEDLNAEFREQDTLIDEIKSIIKRKKMGDFEVQNGQQNLYIASQSVIGEIESNMFVEKTLEMPNVSEILTQSGDTDRIIYQDDTKMIISGWNGATTTLRLWKITEDSIEVLPDLVALRHPSTNSSNLVKAIFPISNNTWLVLPSGNGSSESAAFVMLIQETETGLTTLSNVALHANIVSYYRYDDNTFLLTTYTSTSYTIYAEVVKISNFSLTASYVTMGDTSGSRSYITYNTSVFLNNGGIVVSYIGQKSSGYSSYTSQAMTTGAYYNGESIIKLNTVESSLPIQNSDILFIDLGDGYGIYKNLTSVLCVYVSNSAFNMSTTTTSIGNSNYKGRFYYRVINNSNLLLGIQTSATECCIFKITRSGVNLSANQELIIPYVVLNRTLKVSDGVFKLILTKSGIYYEAILTENATSVSMSTPALIYDAGGQSFGYISLKDEFIMIAPTSYSSSSSSVYRTIIVTPTSFKVNPYYTTITSGLGYYPLNRENYDTYHNGIIDSTSFISMVETNKQLIFSISGNIGWIIDKESLTISYYGSFTSLPSIPTPSIRFFINNTSYLNMYVSTSTYIDLQSYSKKYYISNLPIIGDKLALPGYTIKPSTSKIDGITTENISFTKPGFIWELS